LDKKNQRCHVYLFPEKKLKDKYSIKVYPVEFKNIFVVFKYKNIFVVFKYKQTKQY